MKRRERERVRLQVLLGQVLLGQVRTERHRYSHTSTTFVRGISSVNKGRLRFFLSLCFALHIGFIHRETHIRSDTVYIRLFFNHNVYLYSPLQYILNHPETQITPSSQKTKSSLQLPFLTKQFKLNLLLLLHRNGRSSASPSHSSLQERTTPRRVSSSDARV